MGLDIVADIDTTLLSASSNVQRNPISIVFVGAMYNNPTTALDTETIVPYRGLPSRK
ncbi:hypothetical protein J6590_039646 [Homalodisca vitripennis]|nr:hypothetical protein J6590_039646 [Homalodisca vitripennis]